MALDRARVLAASTKRIYIAVSTPHWAEIHISLFVLSPAISVSGMLTARFLLSLREWESKNNAQARTAELPKSEIEFQVNGATSVFSIHDFGEDMVEERRTGKAREII